MDKEPINLGDIFHKHIEFEFDKEDVDATMTTMTDNVHLVCPVALYLPYITIFYI
jgi:hypothetical protein